MTNPIIERAARAMCIADGYNPDNDDQVAAPPGLPNWGLYEDKVRAVLRAIREPSVNMLRAGEFDSGEPGGAWSITEDQAERTWQAMIDAALGEG